MQFYSLAACIVIGKYTMVVFPVVEHIWTVWRPHIFSFKCMEYLSCKSGGRMLYITSTALNVSKYK